MVVETVTIINNSGKIISNGKHLLELFKEAKASYQEKKAAVKAERAILQRSNTFDVATVPQYHQEAEHLPPNPRRISNEDVASHASSRRTHRSRHTPSERHGAQSQSRPALTASNLQTLSEVSATAPSRAAVPYMPPYAETAPWETALSRPNMPPHTVATHSRAPPTLVRAPTMPLAQTQYDYDDYESTVVPTPRHSTYVQRSRSDPSLKKPKKEIDMNLAYGNIPPDLEHRVDLDPAYRAAQKEDRARSLTKHIEGLLTEAHVVQHTATHMIKHLQQKPEAAAAVALTLAELSTLIGKMSPAFIGGIKASSPAVFALLASPQFLVAAGLTAGLTVVMFGGWKIVKRMKEQKALEAAQMQQQQQAMAFEAYPEPGGYGPPPPPGMNGYPGPYPYPAQGYGDGQPPQMPPRPRGAGAPSGTGSYDEALVLEEELSTIESWRRGIEPSFGGGASVDGAESADLELISPEADRAIRSQYGDDARSMRTSRTKGTTRTHRTHRTDRTERTHRSSHRRSSSHGGGGGGGGERRRERDGNRDEAPPEVPERGSSRAHSVQQVEMEGESLADTASERSHRSHRSHRSSRSHREGGGGGSSGGKRPVRAAIEDGSKDRKAAEEFDVAVRGGPPKGGENMLKSLFKRKKDREEGGESGSRVKGESSLVLA